jgi:membrane associated rhomboid family serine protease
MFALFIFGSILEKVIGYKNFLKVFFFAGILSGIVSIFFYDSVIGASGAIFGIMGTLALLRPKMIVWGLGIPMYMMVVIIVYAALDFAGVFYPDNIAHIGHLSALASGIIIGFMWKKKYGVVEKKKKEKPLLSEEEFRRWEDKYMKRK